jgi:hypothetical protein
MNIDQLSKNMLKPIIFNELMVENESFATFFIKNPYFFRQRHYNQINNYFEDNESTFKIYFKLTLCSKNGQGIEYNPLEMIQYFNSFSEFQCENWDDNKEFDFSLPTKIVFSFKVSDEFAQLFLKTMDEEFDSFKKILQNHTGDFENKALNDLFHSFIHRKILSEIFKI